MTDFNTEIRDLENHIERLKSHKKRNGTKIYYAERRLSELWENPRSDSRSNRSPRSSQREKAVQPLPGKASPSNRAYVLSGEIHDLTRAMVALTELRR